MHSVVAHTTSRTTDANPVAASASRMRRASSSSPDPGVALGEARAERGDVGVLRDALLHRRDELLPPPLRVAQREQRAGEQHERIGLAGLDPDLERAVVVRLGVG